MDNSLLVWFNQASNSSIKHTSDTLKDGKHLLQFAQSKLPNTDSSTVVQSTSTFNNNNFAKLRFIIQQFLTHPSILDEIKEPLSHQLKHLNTDHYLDYLEILLCCCVGLNLFLDPNTAAIEYVLTFHLLYRHLLYHHLLYRHLIYRHLLYRHLCYFHLLYRHLLYRHWIIPTSTRPSLDLRSPSADCYVSWL